MATDGRRVLIVDSTRSRVHAQVSTAEGMVLNLVHLAAQFGFVPNGACIALDGAGLVTDPSGANETSASV